MADVATLAVALTARDQLSGPLGKMERRLESVAQRAKTMGKAFTVVGGAITGVFALAIKSSQEQQVGINRLDAALKNVGQTYADNRVEIEKNIDAIQRKTNFGDEAQRDALQKLVTIGGTWNNSLNALKITTDVAAGANIDLNAAALLVGKAIAGETSSLSRYGIMLEKGATQTEVMAALTKQFGGAAEAAADPFTQLKNRLGDMLQVLGDALLPTVQAVTEKFEAVTRRVIAWTEEHPKLTKFLAMTAAAVGGVLLVLGPLLLMLPALIAGIGALGVVIGVATGPIGIITVAVAALTAGAVLLWRNWDTVWAGIKAGTEAAVNFIIGLFNKMTFVHRAALAGMIDVAKKFMDAIPGGNPLGDAMGKASAAIRAGIPDIDITAEKTQQMAAGFDMAGEAAVVAGAQIKEGFGGGFVAAVSATADATDKMASLLGRQLNDQIAARQATIQGWRDASAEHQSILQADADKREALEARVTEKMASLLNRQVNDRLSASQKTIQSWRDESAEHQRILQQSQNATDRAADALRAQGEAIVFNLSDQGQAWQTLGGNAQSVIEAIRATTGQAAADIIARFSESIREGEGLNDLFKRLGEEGVINLQSLVEQMDLLKESTDKATKSLLDQRIAAGLATPEELNQINNRERSRLQSAAMAIQRQIGVTLAAGGDVSGLQAEMAGVAQGLNAIPAAAHGGRIGRSGHVLVGDGGPEIISASSGASITPLTGRNGGVTKVLNLTVNQNSPTLDARDAMGQIVTDIANEGGFDGLFGGT
jgi:hypothetical protein